MGKWIVGLILFCSLCASWNVAKAEPPNYSWHQELKAWLGTDGRSWVGAKLGDKIDFEGTTSDGSETTFTITNPTRDNEVTFADGTGTVALHNLINIYFGSSATKTLDTNESQASVLRAYGTSSTTTITAAPSIGQVYILVNDTTNTLTIKIANGTGTTVASGSSTICYAGTNTDILKLTLN